MTILISRRRSTLNEFGLTVAVTQNRRVNAVALKCHRVVSRWLYEAPLWVAFDNAQKEILRFTGFLQEASIGGAG
jgi:hypothetical protein